jgi:hypothetical protein
MVEKAKTPENYLPKEGINTIFNHFRNTHARYISACTRRPIIRHRQATKTFSQPNINKLSFFARLHESEKWRELSETEVSRITRAGAQGLVCLVWKKN